MCKGYGIRIRLAREGQGSYVVWGRGQEVRSESSSGEAGPVDLSGLWQGLYRTGNSTQCFIITYKGRV